MLTLILPLVGYLAVAIIITWTAAAYQRWRSRPHRAWRVKR